MILETSFLIDLMKGQSEAVALADEIDHSGESLYLPAPALFELWLGAGRSGRGREEVRKIETLIESFDVMVLTHEDAREAGGRWGRLTSCSRGWPVEEGRPW